jgi:chromosome segregation ATPase
VNERIRELYEQTRLHAKTVNADLDPQGWMDEYHKKFAELIIEECAKRTEAYSYMSDNFNTLAEELRSLKDNISELKNEKNHGI